MAWVTTYSALNWGRGLAFSHASRTSSMSAGSGHVGNALGQHADKRPAGGVALAVNGKLLRGKMAPARLDHALFEGCWPSCHAIIKTCLRLCPRQCARAVTIAHRFVFDHVI